jgi:hypothetical protein
VFFRLSFRGPDGPLFHQVAGLKSSGVPRALREEELSGVHWRQDLFFVLQHEEEVEERRFSAA